MSRRVVATMWDRPRTVVRRLPEDVDALSDEQVFEWLKWLGLDPPAGATDAERRARLAEFPTQADLDQIGSNMVAANNGIRPVVRVIPKSINWGSEAA